MVQKANSTLPWPAITFESRFPLFKYSQLVSDFVNYKVKDSFFQMNNDNFFEVVVRDVVEVISKRAFSNEL